MRRLDDGASRRRRVQFREPFELFVRRARDVDVDADADADADRAARRARVAIVRARAGDGRATVRAEDGRDVTVGVARGRGQKMGKVSYSEG